MWLHTSNNNFLRNHRLVVFFFRPTLPQIKHTDICNIETFFSFLLFSFRWNYFCNNFFIAICIFFLPFLNWISLNKQKNLFNLIFIRDTLQTPFGLFVRMSGILLPLFILKWLNWIFGASFNIMSFSVKYFMDVFQFGVEFSLSPVCVQVSTVKENSLAEIPVSDIIFWCILIERLQYGILQSH